MQTTSQSPVTQMTDGGSGMTSSSISLASIESEFSEERSSSSESTNHRKQKSSLIEDCTSIASAHPLTSFSSHSRTHEDRSNKLITPVIKVSSTSTVNKFRTTPQLKSISNIVQNSKSSGIASRLVNSHRHRSASGERANQTVLNRIATKASKDPSIMMPSAPLVINHFSNGDKKSDYNDTSIIPTLSSQLIFSSFITTQAKSPCSISNARQSALSSSKTTVESKSSGGQANNQLNSKSTKQTGSAHSASTANVVSARLIVDMGKELLDAAKKGHTEQVRQLVVNSGAPFTSDWLGTTALHLAAQNGHAEIADILLRGGVNRDARTKLERTALHLAAQGGCLEVVDLLLIHGSDVNARDMLKMTPLHWAVERGHTDVVEKLLFSGADINVRSKFQLTPFDIAQNSDCYQMLELFKSWTNKAECLNVFANINSFCESQDMSNVDYRLSIEDNATTSRDNPILDIDEPCIDLVELEWNTLNFEPEFFLSNDEEDEPKVEYLMKIVEELQRENRQLRKRVEQLTTTY